MLKAGRGRGRRGLNTGSYVAPVVGSNLIQHSAALDLSPWTGPASVAGSIITASSTFQDKDQSVATLTGDYTLSIAFKKTAGATTFPGFSHQDSTTTYHSVAVNTNTGVATARTGEGATFAVVDSGTGYWIVSITATNPGPGNNQVFLYPVVNTDASATWTGGTGSVEIGFVQLEPGAAFTSYVAT